MQGKTDWSTSQSTELYGIDYWGAPYFRINSSGNVEVSAAAEAGGSSGKSRSADLNQLVGDLKERGLRLPILIRFPDIIKARIELLTSCFSQAIKDCSYKGSYSGVYPIKVNQQRHLIEEIADFGQFKRLGLECGSKPELLVALAHMNTANALIICNGFKDKEYIETALLSLKLGRNTLIVVDRRDELKMIIDAAKKLKIRPKIGFRAKLNAKSSGKWVESSGARSKFGLTPSEMVAGIETLKKEDLLSSLELIHFHIGSQIPSIQSIKSAVKEGTRYYTELYQMGANLKYIDVGGGLGVDYDGSGRSDSSTNYSEQEYANDVVSIIQSLCDEKQVPHPDIVSESGRSLVAHSSVLVFDVLGVNRVSKPKCDFSVNEKDSRIVRELQEIYQGLDKTNVNEYHNDLIEKKRDINQLFAYGVLNLEQRAKAEDLYWASSTRIHQLAKDDEELQDIYWALEKEHSDTYFCNFSVFQSLPDSWAVGQHFPVMPIHRLNETPDRRATLADLTCDSDGKINSFIDFDADEPQSYLEVHEINPNEPYYMAAFLAGAYQETLGDLHNLFGDTDAVHISLNENGYSVDQVVRGDSVKEVLSYVQYEKDNLLELIRKASETSIIKGELSKQEARLLMNHYERGLASYTYLQSDEEDSTLF